MNAILAIPSAQTDEAPLLIELGRISACTLGSGGNESDDCSSGYYASDDE